MNTVTAYAAQIETVASDRQTPKSAWSRMTAGRSNIARMLAALATFGLAASPLQAGELTAMTGGSVDLGGFHGIVYYTSEEDGYRVVATFANDEAGSPMRFSTVLAEDQSATISVPGKAGEEARSLRISRSGDKLLLTEAGRASEIPAVTQ